MSTSAAFPAPSGARLMPAVAGTAITAAIAVGIIALPKGEPPPAKPAYSGPIGSAQMIATVKPNAPGNPQVLTFKLTEGGKPFAAKSLAARITPVKAPALIQGLTPGGPTGPLEAKAGKPGVYTIALAGPTVMNLPGTWSVRVSARTAGKPLKQTFTFFLGTPPAPTPAPAKK